MCPVDTVLYFYSWTFLLYLFLITIHSNHIKLKMFQFVFRCFRSCTALSNWLTAVHLLLFDVWQHTSCMLVETVVFKCHALGLWCFLFLLPAMMLGLYDLLLACYYIIVRFFILGNLYLRFIVLQYPLTHVF